MPRKRSKSPKHKTRPRSKSKKTKSRSKSRNKVVKYGGDPDPTPVKISKYGRDIFVQEWIDKTGVYNNPNITQKTGWMVFNGQKAKLDANYVESTITKNGGGQEITEYFIMKEWREGTRDNWKYRESKSADGKPGIPEPRVIIGTLLSFDDKMNDNPCRIVYRSGSDSFKMLYKIYFYNNKFWVYEIPSNLYAQVPKKLDYIKMYKDQDTMNYQIDRIIAISLEEELNKKLNKKLNI